MKTNVNDCIACGRCTAGCVFLDKYQINLQEYAGRPELAYHCFLCRECERVCPVSIDGGEVSLDLRQRLVAGGDDPCRSGYALLLAEKSNYLFRNYRKAGGRAVLFPGCNFPSYFPATTAKLEGLFRQAGIGTVYDCCGKPVHELGMTETAGQSLKRVEDRLRAARAEEIIVLCPNCYHYLNGRIDIKVSNVYDKLQTLGLVQKRQISNGILYIPCPERGNPHMHKALGRCLDQPLPVLSGIQCCGAGGCAGAKEPELAAGLGAAFGGAASGDMVVRGASLGDAAFGAMREKNEIIYTYCATCAGMIRRGGGRTAHILCQLLDCPEQPAAGIKTVFNRMSRWF